MDKNKIGKQKSSEDRVDKEDMVNMLLRVRKELAAIRDKLKQQKIE